MAGLVQGLVTGQTLALDTEVTIANAAGAAGANPTQAEYALLVGKFNALLAVLKSNGNIKS